MQYTIVKVHEQTRPWVSEKAGPMMSYRIDVRDSGGIVSERVELAQKTTTAPPVEGSALEGDIDLSGSYGPKMKKAYAAGPGGGRVMSPEDRASIVRQHSQEMAMNLINLAATWGLVDKPADTAALFQLVEGTTEWFVKDARKVTV